MPSLAIELTLQQPAPLVSNSIVAFMTGILLGTDPQVRSWISFYIRNGQKTNNDSQSKFRTRLHEELVSLVNEARMYQQRDGAVSQHVTVKASGMLRLYAALRGIAGMK